MAVFDADEKGYLLAEIDGEPVLFTNMRIDCNTVPNCIFCYDIRDSGHLDGSIAEFEQATEQFSVCLHPKPLNLAWQMG